MPKTSFIKIYGPPLLKAIKALEKIAVDMPEVCIMDSVISGVPDYVNTFRDQDFATAYFSSPGMPIKVEVERCNTIISNSGGRLGEHDFFFEWFSEPTMNQVNDLIEKIDETLTPLGCKYTITTKG